MDENSRRSLHQLITRALDKDAQATAAIEEMIVGFDRVLADVSPQLLSRTSIRRTLTKMLYSPPLSGQTCRAVVTGERQRRGS